MIPLPPTRLFDSPTRDLDVIDLDHHDPIAKRTLRLAVLTRDGDGRPLDEPEPLEVLAVLCQAHDGRNPSRLSYADGTLCVAVADCLLREFQARLRVDDSLRAWLLAEVRRRLLRVISPPVLTMEEIHAPGS